MRKGEVYLFDRLAGVISEDSNGIFRFAYDAAYLTSENPLPISRTMPLTSETYESDRLFPFFDGLIPEGWLLDVAEKSWKLDSRDRMGLLLSCCRKCIGAVSVVEVKE